MAATHGHREGPLLSVAMIARQAEDLLGPTLESVRLVADEIVVVDTGSTDGTAAVAKRHGAKVFSHPWDDDFSTPRNFARSQVSGRWILWLDAGERLDAEAAAALRDFLARQADPGHVYALYVVIPPTTADGSPEQIARIRLVPNRPELAFSGRVRETLKLANTAANMELDVLPWRIHRGEREHSPEVKLRRARRDLKLSELEMVEEGESARLWLVRGEALADLNDMVRAADCFRRVIGLSPRGSTEMLAAYYGLLTTFGEGPLDRQSQLAACLEALEAYPLDAQLLCAMGNYLQLQNRFDLAARSFQLAHEHGTTDPATWRLAEIQEIAASCQSLSLQLTTDVAVAQSVLESAVGRWPASRRLRRQLLRLFVDRGLRDEALRQVDLLPQETPHREALRSAVRGACLAAERNWLPAMAYLQTAYRAGCRDPILLRAYVATLIANGQTDAAEPVLRLWRQIEPQDAEAAAYDRAIQAQRGLSAEETLGEPSDAPFAAQMPSDPSRRRRIDQPESPPDSHATTGRPTTLPHLVDDPG